ncbi:hypothetical protein D9M68_789400 [compost metagenome]
MQHVEAPHHVHVEDLADLCVHVGRVDAFADQDAGVVDQCVHRADLAAHLLGKRGTGRHIGDVECEGPGVATCVADGLHGGRAVFGSQVHQHHAGTSLRVVQGDGAADAGGSAGDQGQAAFQQSFVAHGVFLF